MVTQVLCDITLKWTCSCGDYPVDVAARAVANVQKLDVLALAVAKILVSLVLRKTVSLIHLHSCFLA
jgi:hypothetical protein